MEEYATLAQPARPGARSAEQRGTTAAPTTPPKTKRRGEIHGLRGLAIGLVVAYHLWGGGRVSGGVDVFLMISAYLMVGSFARKGMAFNVLDFLVGRFRRLIPSSAVVILLVCGAGWLLLPPVRWYPLLDQALASITYRQNWLLISMATDYTSPDRSGTSPLQHYWSLSVQGQIFVVWPLLMLLAMLVFKLAKVPIKISLTVIFSVITIASFAYALREVGANPVAAYFDTYARAWEFSLASLFALMPIPKMSVLPRAVLSWIGLFVITFCGVFFGNLPYPGPVALIPSIATALVIIGGSSREAWHPARLLNSRPIAWLGDRAYALYLWHWPVLMFWLNATVSNSPGIVGSVIVIALSLILADLTTRTIEQRFNQMKFLGAKRWGLATIATGLLIGFGAISSWSWVLQRDVQQTNSAPAEARPGARAITPGAPVETAVPNRSIAPGDTIILTDWPEVQPPCSADLTPKPPASECTEIKPPGEAHKTVVIMGDSHSNQWLTLMSDLARREQWHLITSIRPGCRITLPNPASDAACVQYSQEMVQYLLELRPDFVFTVGSRAQANGPEIAVDTYLEATKPLTDAGLKIVNIRDNPRFDFKMPECVQRYGAADPRCLKPRSEKLAPISPQVALEPTPGMLTMDPTEYICPGGMCPGVIGNVYVYMDDNHLSRTYVTTLKEEFEDQLWRVIER
ncbi:acyltransferase [Enemella evansiae]|nr:acyltransferase [Enemella evansiae]